MDQKVHAELERRVISKVTRRLIPFMALLYFINYLDRTNISFAKLTMSADLALTETMFGIAAGIFFIGYLLFEVPSNLAMHRFGARIWMARILLSWGVVASLMAFVPNATVLYAFRFLLGIAEAGFFPGMILYLTYWFPARHRARIVGLFLTAIPLSSALGAPLSGALMEFTDGALGLAGWRWMFLLEGLPALLLGVLTFFVLTDRPSKATWLSDEERDWLEAELAAEGRSVGHSSVRQALTSGRTLALAGVYFGVVYGLYALSFFLPSIVAGFQESFNTTFSLYQVGLVVAVPYLFGAVAMVWWTRRSDRTGEREWHIALPALLGALCIPIALYMTSPMVTMLVVTLAAVGIFCALPVFWTLPSKFLTGASAAAGIALINSLGNLAGFGAPFITGWLTDATGSYRSGLWLVGVMMALAAAIAVSLRSRSASN